MKWGVVIVAALLALPAAAEEVEFRGHVLEVDGSQEARPVVRMLGTRYAINASAAQLADKARACLARQPGVSDVAPADAGPPEASLLIVRSSLFSSLAVRSRLAVEVDEGGFRIVQSGLGTAASADAAEGFTAIAASGGTALGVLVEAEQGLVDCLYG